MRTVRIKTWDEMKKEFGLEDGGDIDVGHCFTEEMETALPTYRIIQLSDKNKWKGYNICEGMIKSEKNLIIIDLPIPEGWEKWDGIERNDGELRTVVVREDEVGWGGARCHGIFPNGTYIQRIKETITEAEIIKRFKEDNVDIKVIK